MTIKRTLSRGLMEFCSLGQRQPKEGLRVLLYHAVGTRLKEDPLGLSIDAGLFKEQMQVLKESPCRLVSVEEHSREESESTACLTFDDGYKDNLTVAAPILADMGIPFTVFAAPAFIQSGSPEYLTSAELKTLAAMPGCTIGSHGMRHRPLAGLSPEECYKELKESRTWLTRILDTDIRAVAYPHGSASLEVKRQAGKAGYTTGLCSRTDVNSPGRDPLMLCRTEILSNDSPRVFRQKLYGAWDWHRFRHDDPLDL